MSSPLDPAVPALTINMREMANQLRISRQSLTVWLDRWPDFPVVRRGTNGLPFMFDPAAVFAFLAARREEQKSSQAAKDEALAQLTFPFEQPAQTSQQTLSLADQLTAVRLRKLHREEAERAGHLTPAADVTMHLTTLFIAWNRSLHTALRQAARDHNLPDAVQRSMDAKLADAQREFVRGAAHLLDPAETADAARA